MKDKPLGQMMEGANSLEIKGILYFTLHNLVKALGIDEDSVDLIDLSRAPLQLRLALRTGSF
jgi:hypothetical protein